METRFIPRKPEHRTAAAVLGIEPPDKFPLVFYRDNCADINLNIDDVLAAPLADCERLPIRRHQPEPGAEPQRDDDRRRSWRVSRRRDRHLSMSISVPDQWHDVRAFGAVARSALRLVDVVIGTEDEINAAMLSDASQMSLTHSQVSDTKVAGDTRSNIEFMLGMGPEAVVEKIGPGRRAHPSAQLAKSLTRPASRSK